MQNWKILAALMTFGLAVGSANADPYYRWSEQVQKATKGLEICVDAYSNAMGNGRSPSEADTYLKNAQKTCSIMKTSFDLTMLTVRQNVDGMDDALAAYHRRGLAGFDEIVPKPGQHPLLYQAEALEKILSIQKQQLTLSYQR